MSLVEIRRFSNPIEAQLARSLLENNGCYASLFDAVSFAYADGFPLEVRLMVLEEEYDDAVEILKADREP